MVDDGHLLPTDRLRPRAMVISVTMTMVILIDRDHGDESVPLAETPPWKGWRTRSDFYSGCSDLSQITEEILR